MTVTLTEWRHLRPIEKLALIQARQQYRTNIIKIETESARIPGYIDEIRKCVDG